MAHPERSSPATATRPTTRLATLLAMLLPLTGCASTSVRTPEKVQKDVEDCMRALYSGDVETVINFTHPAVLAKLGGRVASHAAMVTTVQQIKKSGMRIESLTFPRAPEFLPVGDRWFAVVPTLSIFASPTQRFESLNFQFGILEPDATAWLYIDGSRVEATDVIKLFPGFPEHYRFPEFYRRKL